MLKKIISGGQTGADRAALDVAIKFNIEHGGWIPKGRRTETGPLPARYQLKEMDTQDYRERTKNNILDSHGTVIISRGQLTSGSKLTWDFAKNVGMPVCSIGLSHMEEFEAAVIVKSFIRENKLSIVNIAGPRLSLQPGIYNDVKTVLETVLYLLFLDTQQDLNFKEYVPAGIIDEDFPGTVKQAVALLCHDLPLKTKTVIANVNPHDIQQLYFTMLEYIRQRVGLNQNNNGLLKNCSAHMKDDNITIEDAVMYILKQLKHELEFDHLLRVVK